MLGLNTRKAAALFMAGQDGSAYWIPPTGNYSIALYDEDGNELSAGGYARQTEAVTGAWEIVESSDLWTIKNSRTINFATATLDWPYVKTEAWFRTGQTLPDFVFNLSALVAVSTGLAYTISARSRVLRDVSAA